MNRQTALMRVIYNSQALQSEQFMPTKKRPATTAASIARDIALGRYTLAELKSLARELRRLEKLGVKLRAKCLVALREFEAALQEL